MHALSADQASSRQLVLDAIAHLDHVLPGQAPIHDFVHHNTLHGFQHLPFQQALAEFESLTGIDCFLPVEVFRGFYAQGRISDADIDAVLQQQFGSSDESPVCHFGSRTIRRRDLHRVALLHELSAISPNELQWQVRQGLPDRALWETLLEKLELHVPELHAEQLLDLSSEHAVNWHRATAKTVHAEMREQALANLHALFDDVGERLTFRGLLQKLTGIDILDQVRPQLIRWCGSLLDEGQTAWRLPQRETLGLYQAWRHIARYDAQGLVQDLQGWQGILSDLPDDPTDAIVQQLADINIPKAHWPSYLERLALEIPGWSGLINWRQNHPTYRADDSTRPALVDYLALRLILERIYSQQLCRELWHCDARLDKLNWHFRKNASEFAVRLALFGGNLPEYLAQSALSLLTSNIRPASDWQRLAERIWTWHCSPLSDETSKRSVFDQGWRLFSLCQAFAIKPTDLDNISQSDLLNWLSIVDTFKPAQRAYLWLSAYERHYQQDLLQALHANSQRGRWATRDERPEVQIVFCMDDREEGIRRHLEEINPAIETLGAAGFFGLPVNYRGLDDTNATALCPVVVTPAHNVFETNQPNQEANLGLHRRGTRLTQAIKLMLHHGLRRHPLISYALIHLAAPFALAGLLVKSFWPKVQDKGLRTGARIIAPAVATQLNFMTRDDAPASPERPRLGFTDQEQADRIAAFLRNIGLTYGFAELVVLMGHGSMSQNNPHLAAYDCGACSGRHGGPNARLFAAMANRPEVRKLLGERGIVIPDDTWFIGAEHNTCDEDIAWYDIDSLPSARLHALDRFKKQMQRAQQMSAHERCRRLASAPRNPKPEKALRHFLNRATDFSQARPELGHATNAAALVGRRSLTQGAFFDRRLFLISYDPTQDSDGTILEGLLLAVGPVGAGINLEYYFSTVNNDRLGCGSKVPHNLIGFCAVMEGASSDLRTGLPRQMIEIHEAMRLQLIIEAKTSVVEKIYTRQPALQELIGGSWLHVSAIDPDDGQIFLFHPGKGFEAWRPQETRLPMRANSPDCYRDETGPVPPMLIQQAVTKEAVCS
ncbi:MAG: DUF2309 domain-containing protein [Gammaproteobacteria bacterium]